MPVSAPEVLADAHDLSGFDCGKPALNTWLRTRALSNQRNGFTVAVVIHDQMREVGHYGLSLTTVEPAALPRRVRIGQPPKPVPCLRHGQPAMDVASAGRRARAALLGHALERSVLGARLTGGRAQ